MSTAPRIKTTVVGSYPVPDWLAALPSEQALVDATRVVIATQEEAGIDLVCDGELYRFDVNHPETNGMIEYFVRPLDGVRTRMSFEELFAYRRSAGWGSAAGRRASSTGRSAPARSTCRDACARAKRLATPPVQVHAHRAAHAREDARRTGTTSRPRTLALALADVARRAGAAPRRGGRPARRGQPARARRTSGSGRRRRSTACSTR